MADEVIVDALPYIDHGYDDVGVRESVYEMVFCFKNPVIIISLFIHRR